MKNLELQSQCFENIKQLYLNYKKDSASRKTEKYLTIRLQSLEEQWSDFDSRHALLEDEIEKYQILH